MTPPAVAADQIVRRGDRSFRVAEHPSSTDGLTAFLGEAEAATLGFFDAALPACTRMIDLGAYVGFMSLYAATQVVEVHAVEASPSHQVLLRANLSCNPGLASRIAVHPVAVGVTDGSATLFRKGLADSGTSLFQTVERSGLVCGQPEATVPQRGAVRLLDELGLDRATLLKIDVEGAEYEILPAIAELLAERQPFLQVSFHPFNLVGADPYRTALLRLRAGLCAAEAVAGYAFIYLHRPPAQGGPDGRSCWEPVGQQQRRHFLRDYLLAQKPVPRSDRRNSASSTLWASRPSDCRRSKPADQPLSSASTAKARSRMWNGLRRKRSCTGCG